MQGYEAECTIDAAHPALPGHFPGNPVVPGVVILDAVLRALAQWQGGDAACEVKTTKFVSPLLPGERLLIRLSLRGDAIAAFECRVDARPVAEGRLRLRRKEA